MRVTKVTAKRFSSYKEVAFDFTSQGLILIGGPTGAGKSTLCDLVPWVLFGRTAKNGAVDEVRQWSTTEPTEGTATIETGNGELTITRIRGGKSNDLYYTFSDVVFRGKDLNDTQKLINSLLGLDADLYLSAAYIHEFSQTSAFFTLNAKMRRQIVDQFVDMRLANNVTDAASDYKKGIKKEHSALETDLLLKQRDLQNAITALEDNSRYHAQWEERQAQRLADLDKKNNTFDKAKQKVVEAVIEEMTGKKAALEHDIAELKTEIIRDEYFTQRKSALKAKEEALGNSVCETCGAPKNTTKKMAIQRDQYALEREAQTNNQRIIELTRLEQQLGKLEVQAKTAIDKERAAQNPYAEQIKDLSKETNPYTQKKEEITDKISVLTSHCVDLSGDLTALKTELADLDLLNDIVSEYRSSTVTNTISAIETTTNRLLTKHFDAEIRVKFEAADGDKLDVTIYKDGNNCVFTQLSKGQRQLLKLTFATAALSAVANSSGITVNAIALDEAFDGLDEQLKTKAYGLLKELEQTYETILVVEHSPALKSMFETQYQVTLTDEGSILEKA